VRWSIRELAAEDTHALLRAVSADGRTDLITVHHELDDSPGAWHLGAVDEAGRVAAISGIYAVPCSLRPQAQTAVQLQNMAVEPALQRQGIGSAVMAEILRRLRATDAVLLWASARDKALPFYERFGFQPIDGSGFTGQTGQSPPYHRARANRLTHRPGAVSQPVSAIPGTGIVPQG
jgi:GNAT superfamily N-acetyltransferase